MGAERVVGGAGDAELVLLGQRQLPDLREPTRCLGRAESRPGELLAVEGRAVEEVRELRAVALVVDRELLVPGARLDLGLEHQPWPSPGRRS